MGQQGEGVLRAVLDSMADSLVATDREGYMTYMNPPGEALFGVDTDAVIGRHVSTLFAAGERARIDDIVRRLTRGEQRTVTVLLDYERPDASTFHAEVVVSALYAVDGTIAGTIGLTRDVTERLVAEAGAARLQAVVDAAAEGIVGIDTDGLIQFFSPAAQCLWGWSAEEVLGRSGATLVASTDRAFREEFLKVLKERSRFRRSTLAVRKDGHQVEIEVSASPVVDGSGEVSGAAFTVLDVSQHRQTERWLERIMDNAPNPIAVKDLDGRYVLYNRPGAASINRTPEELVGRTDSELLPEHEAAVVRRYDELVIATGEPQTFAFKLVDESAGVSHWVVIEFPLFGPDRRVESIGVIGSDVTELRRAEADQAQLAALVQSAPEAIVARDENLRILAWNPGAERMFGYSAEDALSRTEPLFTVAPEVQPEYNAMVAQARSGQAVMRRLLCMRADGTRFHTQTSVAAFKVESTNVSGTLAIIRDISDLVAAEQALADHARQLKRSNDELEQFAYAASHDLQEPLQAIRLSSTAVLAAAIDRLDADERELLEHVDATATRLSRQIGELMQIAQVALDTTPRERAPLAEAVRDAVARVAAVASEAGSEIVVREPLPAVTVPRTEASLVLQNLLSNAIRYRRHDVPAVVEIAGRMVGPEIELRVTDNGVGMTQHELSRVFGLFQRGASVAPGTGLGLALARRLLERHGGTLVAHSEGQGRGSEFVLRLPLSAC